MDTFSPISPQSMSVWIDGELVSLRDTPCSIAMGEHLVPLTKTELSICAQLLQQFAQPVPYAVLDVLSLEGASHSLQQHISRLRPRLHQLGFEIYLVRNMGYVLKKRSNF
jgi:DNA-binding response OmpR family regulator